MTEKDERMHLPKVNAYNFYSTQKERDEEKLEKVQVIPINKISDFPNHPYKVRDDEEMEDMTKSIKEMGVLHPVLVRPKQNGEYEMISGHRRKQASQKAGKTEIRAIVREMTDEEATIIMVDSNKQREKVLPSEKAFAYKMKLDAMKRQGQRNDLTCDRNGHKLEGQKSVEILSDETNESATQIKRFVRLTYLIPELLQFVDNHYLKLKDKLQMALTPAVEISYLEQKEQDILLDAMEERAITPSTSQAQRLRNESENNTLTEDKISEILDEEKPNQKDQIKFNYDKVKQYFPKDYTIEKMEKVIEVLLQKYQKQWQNKEKEHSR